MKTNFKPLGLAAAVAAASAGYAGVTNAQLSDNGLGDFAIVPYYTVQGDFVSGLHIINTSDATQVVKLRWRRGSDSMDALDFNLILSPKDEWTGFIDDSSGNIVVRTDDATCTAPLRPAGDFPMPSLYRTGAEEGYIEVIGMGQAVPYVPADATAGTPEVNPINLTAKHSSLGIPADCAATETNFFRQATTGPVVPGASSTNGVYSSSLTLQTRVDATTGAITYPANNFVDTPDVLKVSYFIRDAASGLEFGSEAVHIQGFSSVSMLTNQEIIIAGADDAYSFLFPDLDGGSPADTARGRYDGVVRQTSALGGRSVINDWSVASARNVSTDWVITLPGQYLMLDLNAYTLNGADGTNCFSRAAIDLALPTVPVGVACDQRDIPVVLTAEVWDREEQTFTSPQGGLVISPEVGAGPASTLLPNEVNVIEWKAGANLPVLDSVYAIQFDVSALGAEFGWAELSVSSDPLKTVIGPAVFDFTGASALPSPGTSSGGENFIPVTTPVPVAGFVAWERSFPSDPSANYGRIIEHSYNTSD